MVAPVVNLRHLAHSSEGLPVSPPGTGLWLSALPTRQALPPAQSCWLALLTGELIIDLPQGDFRVLKPHHLIALQAGQYSLGPLKTCVVLCGSPLAGRPDR